MSNGMIQRTVHFRQKGATGVGVSSVNTYFLASASAPGTPSGAPGGSGASGWVDNGNSLITSANANNHLYESTCTQYTDGTYTWTTPIDDGLISDMAATGEEFALADSGTTAPTTGWSTSVTPSAGKWIWSRTKLTFKSGSPQYVNIQCVGYCGTDGKGISSADIMFCLASGNNPSNPPSDSSFTATSFADLNITSADAAKYVWQCTKTTYTSGSPTYTGKVCLGKVSDFASVVEQYALGTSTAATGTWQDNTPPAPVKGSYLWTRTKLTYTGGGETYSPSQTGICLGYYGNDGLSQEEYVEYEEMWGDSPTTHPAENSPEWSPTTPAKNRQYLWRRSRRMVLREDKSGYDAGVWGNYICLSGTNGTSINTRGTVLNATKRGGTGGSSTTLSAGQAELSDGTVITCSNGDCVVQEDNGHLYQWLTEGGAKWVDLGQFKGDPGTTYYTHIAWATSYTAGSQPARRTGQKTTPNATAVTGYSVAPFDGAACMGVLVDAVDGDPTGEGAELYYTWSKTKGENAPYSLLDYAIYDSRSANEQGIPSGNIAPGTSWSTVAPVPIGNYRFVWQRTRNFNADGTLDTTSYACLTGADGQQGSQGLTGRMYYIAGKWDATKRYTRTTDLCPVVYHKVGSGSNMIEWWYLTADESTGNMPYDGSGYWAKVENFGVVLTEAIFVKEFAQFGSCIITGDWLISVHGKINSVEKGGSVENPDMYPNDSGSPTYTWFDPLFPGGQLPNLFFDGSTYCANQEHVGWQGDNYDYKELTDVGAFSLLSQDKYAIYRFRMVIVPSNATDYYVYFILKSGSVRKYLGVKLIEENTQQELTVGNVTLSTDGSYMLAAELQYMGNISSWTYPVLYSGASDRGLNYVPIFYKSTSGGNPGTPTFTKMGQISGDSSLSNTWCRYNQNSGTVYVSWGLKSNANTPGFWLKKFYIERTDNYMFIPNYAVDLKTGRSYQNDAHLKGLLSTLNDMVVVKEENQTVGNGWLTITDRGLFCRNDKDDSNNEVIAAIGVHKESQQSYVYEKGFVDLITRAKNSSNYDYATISGAGAYFTRHEIVGGVDEITQTYVGYSYVDTNEVRTNKIIGRGYESGYGNLPVAMPQNIITGSGNKYLPANPKEGMVVFAKGTGGNMTVKGNGKKIMNPVGTGEVDDFSILSNSFIFAYDGIRWIAFCCIDTGT